MLKSNDLTAKSKAAVPELTPIAYFEFINLQNSFSNLFTSSPRPSQDLLNTFLTALISSLSKDGLKSLIFFYSLFTCQTHIFLRYARDF